MSEESIKRRAATASYVEDMLGELTQLARHMKCDFLQFLLEMAQQEAANIKVNNPTSGRRLRLHRKGSEDEEQMSAEELAAIFVRKYSSEH